ncbi:MAG TPA: hypothetical protein VJX70_14105 [Candidatus Acidoferrum sp.]|nr:hypothetical protein [Candidatus Acidoferrum sp.]
MNLYVALKSVSALIALWFFVYYLWRDYRIDAFREHLFSIRDRMFMYAAEGNIRFDHPAYTSTRTRANLLIRHGHHLTLTRFTIVVLTHPTPDVRKILAEWARMTEDLPPDAQLKMLEFRLCISVASLQHMVYSSFFRYLIARPLTLFKDPFKVNELREHPTVANNVERLECDTVEQELPQEEAPALV